MDHNSRTFYHFQSLRPSTGSAGKSPSDSGDCACSIAPPPNKSPGYGPVDYMSTSTSNLSSLLLSTNSVVIWWFIQNNCWNTKTIKQE